MPQFIELKRGQKILTVYAVDIDGEIQIEIESRHDNVETFFINKAQALTLIKHLNEQFNF